MSSTTLVRKSDPIDDRFQHYRKALAERGVRSRLFQNDVSIWRDILGSAESAHCADWTDSLRRSMSTVSEVPRLRADCETVVLIGMGGASLSTRAYSSVFGYATEIQLQVADSTSPEFLRPILDNAALPNRFYAIASKSGGTIETLDIARSLHECVGASDRFCAITDPAPNPLREWAQDKEIPVYSSDPFVPGRYSALSTLGLLPMKLLGHDLEGIRAGFDEFVENMLDDSSSDSQKVDETAAVLASLVCEPGSRLMLEAEIHLLPVLQWVEQIVSESLGKSGLGILPVIRTVQAGGTPRSRVRSNAVLENQYNCPIDDCELTEPRQIARFFMFWQTVISMTGSLAGIDPFGQPDVEQSKRKVLEILRTRDAHTGYAEAPDQAVEETEMSADAIRSTLQHIRENARTHDYIALLAFAEPSGEMLELLTQLQAISGKLTDLTTVLNFGPQYLHSTGQFHKGGPSSGHYLTIGAEESVDLSVSERPYTFGQLFDTQLHADMEVLSQSQRPVHYLTLKQPVSKNLREVIEQLQN
ncbi:MAG: hypothetical protein OXI60_04020 [Acidiferrobacterales bacterium]|nr:hypothetical protein [Acidiferrobacterales bacterium]